MVKLARSLKLKKYRRETGKFVIEGAHLLEEAIKTENWPDFYFYVPQLATAHIVDMVRELNRRGVKGYTTTEKVLRSLADTEAPQGIVAVMNIRERSVAGLCSERYPVLVVLDGVSDPGNAGAIIRTAAAAGCSGVIFTKGCADPHSPKSVRASQGAIFRVPVVGDVGADELLGELAGSGVRLVVADVRGAKAYYEIAYTGSLAVVVGSEARGVSPHFGERASEVVSIPLARGVESLNVAVACGIILFEAVRQRRCASGRTETGETSGVPCLAKGRGGML